jgi:hypothetical protein
MLKKLALKLLPRRARDFVSVYRSHSAAHGRFPDLKHQPTFSDRMAFRRLFPQPIFAALTDKVQVRDFVRSRLGEDYLVPIYCITSDIEHFSFEDLPLSFAMKASHGCGWNEFVEDRRDVDVELLRQKARSWLTRNFYFVNRECHYRDIPARILFEKLLTDKGRTPKDYKIHCFRKDRVLTQIIQVHSDRFDDHKVNFFTPDWIPITLDHGYPSSPAVQLTPPDNLSAMLAAADTLSEGFNYVRVDFYSIDGRIYFGEMTFTPAAGLFRFNPIEADKEWAALFDADPSYFEGNAAHASSLKPRYG